MREIDEYSQVLGTLQSEIKNHSQVHNIILSKLDKIDDKLTLMNGSVGKAHGRIDGMEPTLEEAHANGNDWKDTKGKVKFLATLGIVGGGVGGFSFSGILTKLLGAE